MEFVFESSKLISCVIITFIAPVRSTIRDINGQLLPASAPQRKRPIGSLLRLRGAAHNRIPRRQQKALVAVREVDQDPAA